MQQAPRSLSLQKWGERPRGAAQHVRRHAARRGRTPISAIRHQSVGWPAHAASPWRGADPGLSQPGRQSGGPITKPCGGPGGMHAALT